MSLTEKKEVLLEIIENVDEKLAGLLIALANEYNVSNEEYSDKEIEEFYKIRDHMLEHPETTYTAEQVHTLIRNKK